MLFWGDFLYLEAALAIKDFIKIILNGGNNNKIPKKSVKKPGNNKKAPDMNKDKLLKISIPGWLVFIIDCLACMNEEIPWYFTVAIPKKAVSKVNNIVEIAPISLPIFTKKYISMAGSSIKIKRNFIYFYYKFVYQKLFLLSQYYLLNLKYYCPNLKFLPR